jgi:hypothetical protein
MTEIVANIKGERKETGTICGFFINLPMLYKFKAGALGA